MSSGAPSRCQQAIGRLIFLYDPVLAEQRANDHIISDWFPGEFPGRRLIGDGGRGDGVRCRVMFGTCI